MPRLSKKERYVAVAYELHCGYERATALADNLNKILRDDSGFNDAEDDTRGWDGDRMAVVVVTYDSLSDAVRLDARVRQLLSRSVDFTYESELNISYSGRGPTSYVTAKTALIERGSQ